MCVIRPHGTCDRGVGGGGGGVEVVYNYLEWHKLQW